MAFGGDAFGVLQADYIDPVTFAAPAGSFGAVAAGYLHTCGLLETGEAGNGQERGK